MEKDDTDKYSKRLEFEHKLINRRLTWLLTSQSILFAAYGLAIRAGNSVKLLREVTPMVENPVRVFREVTPTAENSVNVFLAVTPIAGIAISGLIFVGVLCGAFAKWNTWQDSGEEEFGVRTWITILALLPDLMLPVMFACAWTWILLGKLGCLFWLILVIGATITVLTLLILYIIGVDNKERKVDKKKRK